MLRPHLVELHRRAQRERQCQPQLTPRQWEILQCVSTGASNAQVARQLGTSQAPVRKHLENIFQRLDVLSRTEAVARVTMFLGDAEPVPRLLRTGGARPVSAFVDPALTVLAEPPRAALAGAAAS